MARRPHADSEGRRRRWRSRARGILRSAACLASLAWGAGCHSGVITTSGGDLELLDPLQPRSVRAVVDIAPTGVNPQVLHLDSPVTVTFTNTDRVAHRLEAAPELAYGDCPEMNGLGTLQPGQAGTVTLSQHGFICAYHDGARPNDFAFQGIVVLH